jgi:hypothetical protein
MEDTLLREIRTFLAEYRMSPSYFGKAAVGNSEMVGRLEAGNTVTLRTAEKARRFMASRRALHRSFRRAAQQGAAS